MEVPQDKLKYGIVVDSGSSGSRIQIYSWPDPKYVRENEQDSGVLRSPPRIVQEKNWTLKTSPGISTFAGKKNKKIWTDHYGKLAKFAQEVIPKNKQAETPVFVLATAGMRLLPKKDQKLILQQSCASWRKNTNFVIGECKDHFQIIDGETEGVYGWVGLNYLMGQLNAFDEASAQHESIGFMDMGGASTQIAFVPSEDQVEKHRDDLSKVAVRNVDGFTQVWNVFVQTWLGFGANEARKRYLKQLVGLNAIHSGLDLNDPCMPKGAKMTFEHDGSKYKITGIGNYNMCVRNVYPLLLKSIPCKDEPCLFNGIHGPKMDFEKDKFVGISEYWYTANDVFNSGGEYNYHAFNEKVKEYCENDWSSIVENSKNGAYNKLDPDKFLKDACFKASWVINILHDGFDLPRLGIEAPESPTPEQEEEDKKITENHIPFSSTDSIDGKELSWTLGKILLYASSQVPPANKKDLKIGIYPSEISGKKFVPAGNLKGYDSDDDDIEGAFYPLVLFFILLMAFAYMGRNHFALLKTRRINSVKKFFYDVTGKIPYVSALVDSKGNYNEIQINQLNRDLEEGTLSSSKSQPSLAQLRTRSAVSLTDAYDPDQNGDGRHYNFLNKPFPKRNPLFSSQNNSRENISRTTSNLGPKKNSD